VKPLGLVLTSCAIAALVISGCSKGSSSSGQASDTSAPTGPITDSESNGLKSTGATAAPGDPVHGKEIFEANCASCHGADATGGVGPNLHGEKGRKNYLQTIAWIENPTPPMAKLYPSPLGDSDVADVAAYVQSL
jgi:mono/diheme cytochrome c family protein